MFEFYFQMINKMRTRRLSHSNPFPKWEGVGADDRIENAIRLYLALLFVRQFILPHRYVHMNPIALPSLPATQAEKKKWIDYMDLFKEQVNEVLSNDALLQALGFDIPDEFAPKPAETVHPLVFIDRVKKMLEEDYHDTLFNQEMDPEKVTLFESTSRDLIIRAWKNVMTIHNPSPHDSAVKKYYVNTKKCMSE